MSVKTVSASEVEKNNYLPYRRALLSPTRIRDLSTLRVSRALRDIAMCWLWILAALAMVAIHPSWWTVLIAIPVVGNRYYALFIIGHDAMHRRLLPDIQRNDFWADLLIFAPIGAITRLNNRNHLAHHKYLSTGLDPDRFKHACFNKSERGEMAAFLSGMATVWSAARAVFVTRGDTRSSSSAHYTLRDFTLLAGTFAIIAGGLTWFVGWWAYPVLWLFPVYTFMYVADNFRSFAEHSHPEADLKADRHRLITYTSNPLERMFVAPMNMNFHTVHHLWPSIPYYNLPAADREVRQNPAAAGLEWRNSYFAYLFRYWSALPIAECRENRRWPTQTLGA
jgi:fatty acid desaturase